MSPQPSRIAETFATTRSQGRIAIMPFAPAGYPDMERCERNILAMVAGGADLIEIGTPFSDPLADGATVQRTSQKALDNGTTLKDCIALVKRLRDQGVTIPLVLMGYFNPALHYGLEKYVTDSAEAGVDGFIVPDLPLESSYDFREIARAHDRDLIFMLAPTSTDERMQRVGELGSGFIYCVAVRGVTGARDNMAADLGDYLDRIRQHTDLPLAVGFGISNADHVREIAKHADGAIVASALINEVDTHDPADQPKATEDFVRALHP